jgi:hypothetical protein
LIRAFRALPNDDERLDEQTGRLDAGRTSHADNRWFRAPTSGRPRTTGSGRKRTVCLQAATQKSGRPTVNIMRSGQGVSRDLEARGSRKEHQSLRKAAAQARSATNYACNLIADRRNAAVIRKAQTPGQEQGPSFTTEHGTVQRVRPTRTCFVAVTGPP